MKKLIFSSEYLAVPIFCPDIDRMGHIDAGELPISEELRQDIHEWDSTYQSTFNEEYPPDSGFASPELEAAHRRQGADLAGRLQGELGGSYTVEYKD